MALRRGLVAIAMCAGCLVLASSALAQPPFRPRVGPALGLVPPFNQKVVFSAQTRAAAGKILVTYHGGQTMTAGITVHAIFWSGGSHPFKPKPQSAPHDYIGMVDQYLGDVDQASTGTAGGTCTTLVCDNFTVEPQYAWGRTPGHIISGDYTVHFSPSGDSILDAHAYPAKADQCRSPSGLSVCVTDAQVQREINRVIAARSGSRGLHNLWYLFLPPGVDECISGGDCGSNAFAGYHGLSDLGHGPTVYALSIDPVIESPPRRGRDPEGFPDAERAIDVVSHEVNEAMSDPKGVGYMDPNGFEIGDKCQTRYGASLGTAGPDSAPYNQVLNGDKYLIQEMWANRDNGGNAGCVQATTNTTNPLPLPQVNLAQFSSRVSGNIRRDVAGVGVTVKLLRRDGSGHPVAVAQGSATTAGDGGWSLSLGQHAVGDDRDEITVDYAGSGAPSPSHQVILTGNGGNPFTESGWTGWFDMDHGSRVRNHPPTLTVAPCFQTGVEAYVVGGKPGSKSPTDFCNTKTDAAATPLSAPAAKGRAIVWSSNDSRAFAPPGQPTPNSIGALVKLSARAGEPGAVSLFSIPLHFFTPGGFPTCTAYLKAQSVTCQGLVPGASYKLADGSKHASAKAGPKGTVSMPLAVKGGDKVTLFNGLRALSTLHVAHLSASRCQPGEYFGPPLQKAPTGQSAGSLSHGPALTGTICPLNGNRPATASGAQTDEFSGGRTVLK